MMDNRGMTGAQIALLVVGALVLAVLATVGLLEVAEAVFTLVVVAVAAGVAYLVYRLIARRK